jgi:chromosome segregation protein
LEMEERVRRLEARRNEHLAARAQAESEVANDSEAQAAETKVTEAQAKLEAATAGIDGAAKAREATEASLSLAREGEATAQTELAKLRAEAKALSDLLAAGRKSGAPILDSIKAAPGYETALGAALGDDLEAPLDETSPRRWSSLAPYSEDVKWANGIKPLSDFIEAPPALARRLSRIGVVESAEMGAELRKELTPGQRLVTQKGDLWRWDGFTMVAGAPSAAAVRLAQRNRLEELSKRLAEAESKAASVREGLDLAKVEAAKAVEAERAARDGARNAERELAAAREALAGHHRKLTAAQSRLEAIRNAVTQSEADLTEAQTQREAARQAFEAIPDSAGEREKLNEFRAEVAEKRSALVEARAAHDRLLREAGERRRRAEAVAQEQNSWRERRDSATTRDGELIEREKTAEAEEARIANLPEEITFKRSTLLDQIALAEENRKQASDQLALAEAAQGEADRALRNVEQILSGAREERVRREALVEQAKRQCRSIAERIAERLECTPEELPNIAGINPDAELPPVDQLERRLERLLKERDDMGPVNLLAETEAQELDTRIAGLRNEREDLIAAIARLRQGIAELNREGRERLLASFKAVDDHFRELFVRLFGGGRAHLTLTESDDPLEAGLEIMASPPGKRLQSLSLLSGGEKALTALALIFAVFMTNPAPICVLDEVDAPLDDANVDRFCSLMEDLANNTATRFLVVTHHRMTMSRMDRLYGVTMAERGISRLVSVDLRAAEALQEGKPV